MKSRLHSIHQNFKLQEAIGQEIKPVWYVYTFFCALPTDVLHTQVGIHLSSYNIHQENVF